MSVTRQNCCLVISSQTIGGKIHRYSSIQHGDHKDQLNVQSSHLSENTCLSSVVDTCTRRKSPLIDTLLLLTVKVIEEAPAPGVSPEFQKKIGKAAVDAAKVRYLPTLEPSWLHSCSFPSFFFLLSDFGPQPHSYFSGFPCRCLASGRTLIWAGLQNHLGQYMVEGMAQGFFFESS